MKAKKPKPESRMHQRYLSLEHGPTHWANCRMVMQLCSAKIVEKDELQSQQEEEKSLFQEFPS